MKLTAAPFFRSNIGNGFSEVPAVAIKVLCVVLTLAVGLVFGLRQNDGSILSRAFAVRFRVLNADLYAVGIVWYDGAFRNREAAVAGFHLNAMIGDTQPHTEAKRLGQPVRSHAGIGINEYRDDGAGRNRTVEFHPETLAEIKRLDIVVLDRKSSVP